MEETILIVADSLALPREDMPYERTWPRLLSQHLPGVHIVSRLQRGLTTAILNKGVYKDWLEFYAPKTVILQVGIVDCAPRYVKNGGVTMKFLAALPKAAKSTVWNILKKKPRQPHFADVSPREFEINLKKYIERCISVGVDKILMISIAKSGSAMLKNNPYLLEQIARYNAIIAKVAAAHPANRVIDVLSHADEDCFLSDGYHLNEHGNSRLFKAIIKLLHK